MKNKKILIVGATGFIGYHLAKHCLKKKWRVIGFSKNKPRDIRRLKKIKYIKGDLFKEKDLRKIKDKIDYVVNLGGYVDHSNKIATYKSHYIGCKNLSNYFLNKNLKSFIQMGSGGEYGKINSPHKETFRCKPKSVYSRSKFLATKHLLRLNKKYNFPCTILRLYQTFGDKQAINRLIPIVITSCIKGKKFPCSEGKQYRDFVHVDDVVSAIMKCINKKTANGQIFNLGTGKPIKIKKLTILIRDKIGDGYPDFGKIKLRNEETLKIFPKVNKIKKLINWKPKMSLLKGLKKTIAAFQEKDNK